MCYLKGSCTGHIQDNSDIVLELVQASLLLVLKDLVVIHELCFFGCLNP